MRKETSDQNVGIGFMGLLTIVFITLKLTGYVTWPWWLVLSPIWAPAALAALIIALVTLVSVWGDK